MKSNPTPAAVRAALKAAHESCTVEEAHAFMQEKRYTEDILRDHIRAIAAEMGAVGDRAEDSYEHEAAQYLRAFADKLEGKA